MALDLEAIVNKFSSNLHGFYDAASNELAINQIRPPRWLKTYLAFASLEKCRTFVGDQGEHHYCHFAMGRRKGLKQQKIHEYLGNARTLSNNIHLPPPLLSEHLVDFTITSATLAQGQGKSNLTNGKKFSILMAAESELVPNFNKVLEDCLKLLDVISPLKVLLMPAASKVDTIADRKSKIEKLFNAHGPIPHQQSSEWLVLGIPLLSDWTKKQRDPARLLRQIYTLELEQETYSLVPKPAWWTEAVLITNP